MDMFERKLNELLAARKLHSARLEEANRVAMEEQQHMRDIDAQMVVVQSLKREMMRAVQKGGDCETFEMDDEVLTTGGPPATPIKELVRSTLAEFEEFNVNQFVFSIRAQEPRAKRNTILVELAAAAKRGEVERVKTGFYRRIAQAADLNRIAEVA